MPPVLVPVAGFMTMIGLVYGGVVGLDAHNDTRYAPRLMVTQVFETLQEHLVNLEINQLITRKELYRRELWDIESLGTKMTARDRQRAHDLEDQIKEVDADLLAVRTKQAVTRP